MAVTQSIFYRHIPGCQNSRGISFHVVDCVGATVPAPVGEGEVAPSSDGSDTVHFFTEIFLVARIREVFRVMLWTALQLSVSD
jgi:hypothetical protein